MDENFEERTRLKERLKFCVEQTELRCPLVPQNKLELEKEVFATLKRMAALSSPSGELPLTVDAELTEPCLRLVEKFLLWVVDEPKLEFNTRMSHPSFFKASSDDFDRNETNKAMWLFYVENQVKRADVEQRQAVVDGMLTKIANSIMNGFGAWGHVSAIKNLVENYGAKASAQLVGNLKAFITQVKGIPCEILDKDIVEDGTKIARQVREELRKTLESRQSPVGAMVARNQRSSTEVPTRGTSGSESEATAELDVGADQIRPRSSSPSV